MSQFLDTATINTTQMVTALTTRLNVSLKSISRVWWNPLATNLALYLSTLPLGLIFSLNTHLFPIILYCGKVQGAKDDFESRHQILLPLSSSTLGTPKHFPHKLVDYQFEGYHVAILKSSCGCLHKLWV